MYTPVHQNNNQQKEAVISEQKKMQDDKISQCWKEWQKWNDDTIQESFSFHRTAHLTRTELLKKITEDDNKESGHDYIQMLFPNTLQSKYDSRAPLVITTEEEQILQDNAAKILENFNVYCKIYGITNKDEKLIFTDDSPLRNMLKTMYAHNSLRFTRILHCLHLCNTEETIKKANAFLVLLQTANKENFFGDKKLSSESVEFWNNALKTKQGREVETISNDEAEEALRRDVENALKVAKDAEEKANQEKIAAETQKEAEKKEAAEEALRRDVENALKVAKDAAEKANQEKIAAETQKEAEEKEAEQKEAEKKANQEKVAKDAAEKANQEKIAAEKKEEIDALIIEAQKKREAEEKRQKEVQRKNLPIRRRTHHGTEKERPNRGRRKTHHGTEKERFQEALSQLFKKNSQFRKLSLRGIKDLFHVAKKRESKNKTLLKKKFSSAFQKACYTEGITFSKNGGTNTHGMRTRSAEKFAKNNHINLTDALKKATGR